MSLTNVFFIQVNNQYVLKWQESDIQPPATFGDYLVNANLDSNQQTEAILIPGKLGQSKELFAVAMCSEQIARFFQNRQLIPVLFESRDYIAKVKVKDEMASDSAFNLDVKKVDLSFDKNNERDRNTLLGHLGALVTQYSPCYSIDEISPDQISTLYIYGGGSAGADLICNEQSGYTSSQLVGYLRQKGLLDIKDLRIMSSGSADVFTPISLKTKDLEYARVPHKHSWSAWFASTLPLGTGLSSFSALVKQELTLRGYPDTRVTGYQASTLVDNHIGFLTSHTRSLTMGNKKQFIPREKMAVVQ